MSQTIDVNGQSINYPETGDTNWGDEATEFAIQTSAAFGKLGLSSGTSVDIPQTLDVTGNTTLDSNLSVAGTTSLTGNVTLTNNLTVNGNTQLGNANTDTIGVTGIVNIDSGVLYVDPINNRVGINDTTPSEALDVTGNVAISGNGTVGGTLGVTGATILSSNLDVTGVFNQMPVGTIITSALHISPSNFLLCDGSDTVSRTVYANLFSAIVPNKGTITVTSATPAVVTLNNHRFLTGESIYLTTTGALPSGLNVDHLYYVRTIDDNTFHLYNTLANAIATSGTTGRMNTSGSQSGTHTLFFCPYGLGSTTSNFKLPDFKSAYLRGRGLDTIFTQHRTTALGEIIFDTFQGHWHNVFAELSTVNESRGVRLANGSSNLQDAISRAGNNVYSSSFILQARTMENDGTNGIPRTGLETRPNSIGVNFFIKF